MKHALSAIVEPTDDDRASAIVTSVHLARELLSLAERLADSSSKDFATAQRYISRALSCLDAASTLLPDDSAAPGVHLARLGLVRAVAASEAALGHAKLAESYGGGVIPQAGFEAQQRDRTRTIWFKATEFARQETHRALAVLVALFPEACEFDDGDQPAAAPRVSR